MTKTEHYQLNQWDAGDRVLREDFNEDNRKIEEAISEVLDLAAGGCKVIVGSYTANGSSSGLSIDLGGQPKAVLIIYNGNSYENIGLFTQGHPLTSQNNGDSRTLARITSTGFTVYYDTVNAQISYPHTNYGTGTYLYLAIM